MEPSQIKKFKGKNNNGSKPIKEGILGRIKVALKVIKKLKKPFQ